MPVLEWVLGLGGAALISFSLLTIIRNSEQEKRLREAFYYLLEKYEGKISLIQLAASARVDAEPAKLYLESQARVFSVLPEVDLDGNTFYRFPKVERSLLPADNEEWN